MHRLRRSYPLTRRPLEATEILARIAKLYKVEAECDEMGDEERYEVRQEGSRPIIVGIFQRLEELKALTPPSEPLHKAIDHAGGL